MIAKSAVSVQAMREAKFEAPSEHGKKLKRKRGAKEAREYDRKTFFREELSKRHSVLRMICREHDYISDGRENAEAATTAVPPQYLPRDSQARRSRLLLPHSRAKTHFNAPVPRSIT